MSDQMEIIRAEAVSEVASAVLRAAGAVMDTHGNDPQGVCIIAAGFAQAIKSMDKIDPVIRKIITRMIA